MNQLDCMRTFVRVAEGGSFTQAALQGGMTKAAVSGAVQRLENLLGTRLLHRTTRRVQLTQDGQIYLARCKDLLADMEELEGLFRAAPADLQGALRVDMPLGVARHVVLPRLGEFLQRHPRIDIALSSTDRMVNLVQEGFDCVLRVGSVADTSLVGRRLGLMRQVNCASAAYLAAHGEPRSLDELRTGHRLVHYAVALGARPAGFEYLDPDSGAAMSLPMPGSLTVNNSDAYQAACLAGLGIIQAPESGLREHIAAGRLVEILPAWRAAPLPVTLLYGHRRHVPRRVQAFMDWLQAILAPALLPAGNQVSS